MKRRASILAATLLAMAGCHVENAPPTERASRDKCEWPSSMSTPEAATLTPDACKTILVARAVLEARTGKEIHARFDVRRLGDDWEVTVFYTPRRGEQTFPGDFTGVVLGPDWKIKSIIGGA